MESSNIYISYDGLYPSDVLSSLDSPFPELLKGSHNPIAVWYLLWFRGKLPSFILLIVMNANVPLLQEAMTISLRSLTRYYRKFRSLCRSIYLFVSNDEFPFSF